jgi:hypothetical protein
VNGERNDGVFWPLLYLLYCVEAGLFLLLVPWSFLWVNSYFAQVPGLRGVLLSGYARGAVSGLGLLILIAGAADLVAFCRSFRDA